MYSEELKKFIDLSKNYRNINYVPNYKQYWKPLLILETNFLPIETGNVERFWFLKNNTKTRPVCLECDNRVNFDGNALGFLDFCCNKCASKSIITRAKIEATNMAKYGHKIAGGYGTDEYKHNMVKKYGGTTSTNSPIIVEKTKLRFITKTIEKIKSQVIPNFSVEDYISVRHIHSWKCVKCNNDFEDTMSNGHVPRCLTCFPITQGISKGEKELADFLKEIYSGTIIENSRDIITPLELDIYLPDENLAIEYDGLFWHSELFKDKNYHLDKLQKCDTLGIRLINIFEDEWQFKKEIVISNLLNILRTNNTISSDSCDVRKIDSKIAKIFLEENHIEGNSKSSIRYGLFKDNLLVYVMTFKKYKTQWELIRQASKKDLPIDGAKKCLNAFLSEYSPSTIITYVDKRWNTKDLYLSLGFTQLEDIKPIFYFYDNLNCKRYLREEFPKNKLETLLENFDPNLSEIQNMQLNNYTRIFDCGKMTFILKKE